MNNLVIMALGIACFYALSRMLIKTWAVIHADISNIQKPPLWVAEMSGTLALLMTAIFLGTWLPSDFNDCVDAVSCEYSRTLKLMVEARWIYGTTAVIFGGIYFAAFIRSVRLYKSIARKSE